MTQNSWLNITTNLVVHYDKYIVIFILIFILLKNESTENIVIAFLLNCKKKHNDLNIELKISNTGLYCFYSAKFHNVPRDIVFLELVSTG